MKDNFKNFWADINVSMVYISKGFESYIET